MRSEPSALREHVMRYAAADDRQAWRALGWTGVGYAVTIALYAVGWWPLGVLLCIGVMLRVFVIFHDALHRSFFTRREWNERLATALQLLTFTPADSWGRNHLAHHRHFGNLGQHDPGEFVLFTRQDYEAMPVWKRRLWRVARSPVVFFPALPIKFWILEYPFVAANRWLWGGLALHAAIAWFVSPWHLLAIYLNLLMGSMLFHLQHGIGDGWRVPNEAWRSEDAALKGSTWLLVKKPFTWFSLGIEFHHVHHLNPAVPCYRMTACHAEAPAGAWDGVTRGTLRSCVDGLRRVMWDGEHGKLVRF